MRTIFITSFHPLISRNIIATPIPKMLTTEDVRVVILVPNYKREYFAKRYGESAVIIEGVETGPSLRTRRVGMLKRLAEAMPNTKRAAIGRKRTLSGTLKSPFYYYFFYVPAGFFGRFLWFHKLVRFFDFLLSPKGRFFALLDSYKPDFIFATDVQNENDVALMQDARRKQIPVVAMVRSWDNLTTRSLRIVPDTLIVHNEIIKKEAIRLYGIKEDSIAVVGIPHYDKYFKAKPMERNAFLESIGADSRKPLIVYIPLCDYRLAKNNVDRFVMELLGELPVTVVVRFPPAETVNIDGYEKKQNVIFDRPGYVFEFSRVGDRDLTKEDDDRYMNLLSHADVIVGGPSTFVIDAAVFDTPIVLVDFYPNPVKDEERIYEYDTEHFGRILESGGARRTRSREEFLKAIEAYLKNPEIDREGRKQIVQEQCFSTDGKASARLAAAVLSELHRR